MAKLEIDLSKFDCPEGYEIFDIRVPKKGEQFIILKGNDGYSQVYTAGEQKTSCVAYAIIRKKFVWPDWIKDGTWLFKGFDKNWYLSEYMPSYNERRVGWAVGGLYASIVCLNIDTSVLDTYHPSECCLRKTV